jgi:type I restriction enzyme, S subunit
LENFFPTLSLLEQQQQIVCLPSYVISASKYKSNKGQTQRLKKGLMQKLLTKGIGHTKVKETGLEKCLKNGK